MNDELEKIWLRCRATATADLWHVLRPPQDVRVPRRALSRVISDESESEMNSTLLLRDGVLTERLASQALEQSESSIERVTLVRPAPRRPSSSLVLNECLVEDLILESEDNIRSSLWLNSALSIGGDGVGWPDAFCWFHACRLGFRTDYDWCSYVLTQEFPAPDALVMPEHVGGLLRSFVGRPFWHLAVRWSIMSRITVAGEAATGASVMIDGLLGSRATLFFHGRRIAGDGVWRLDDRMFFCQVGRLSGVLLREGDGARFWFGDPSLMGLYFDANLPLTLRSLPCWAGG